MKEIFIIDSSNNTEVVGINVNDIKEVSLMIDMFIGHGFEYNNLSYEYSHTIMKNYGCDIYVTKKRKRE